MSETIAVVGASTDRRKFGNKCVRAYKSAGFRVFPVNLRGQEIEGLQTYPRLDQVPGELDLISVYLPPQVTRDLVSEIARRVSREVWFNPGSADAKILQAAREAGIHVRDGCSIVAIGLSPSQFP